MVNLLKNGEKMYKKSTKQAFYAWLVMSNVSLWSMQLQSNWVAFSVLTIMFSMLWVMFYVKNLTWE